MTFEVLSSDFASRLSAISRVLVSKNAAPILDNLHFRVQGSQLTITGSDGDITMQAILPIENVTGKGDFLAIPNKIIESLKDLPQQQITIELSDADPALEISVSYANGNFKCIGKTAEEYPFQKEQESDTKSFSIAPVALLSGIQSCIFATADDEMRPIMTGIYCDLKTDHVVFVASDSKKLVRLINRATQPGFDGGFILPRKPANLLKGVLTKDGKEVKVSFDNRSARFDLGDYVLSCRLIEGKYPRYDTVIPKNNNCVMTIDRSTLLVALRRISVNSNTATNLIRFDVMQNSLTLSSSDIDYSTASNETIPCSYDSMVMSIGFRASFFIDMLNVISSDEVEIRLYDPARPGLLSPVQNNEGEELVMLIMPMMLTDF